MTDIKEVNTSNDIFISKNNFKTALIIKLKRWYHTCINDFLLNKWLLKNGVPIEFKK